MNTKLYSGTGSSQNITGVGFQPDFVWCKARSGTWGSYNHNLFDVIRGVTKRITSNDTLAEATVATSLTAFNADGWTGGGDNETNNSGTEYVSWNWLANGAGSANTDGSISSTVSANTTSGFSIVSYTGTGSLATVGHGLGMAPKMILIKDLSTRDWAVYHEAMGNTYGIYLNLTNAQGGGNSDFWGSTSPTSTVFTINTRNENNNNGSNYIAYCFADVQGFSKMGSYTGNGDSDGPFIFTGFKPSFIMFKSTSTTGGWEIHDNKRDPFNVSSKRLFPNLSNAEATEDYVDFVSNGFKFRTNDANGNTNGVSYIYMAFAEAPLVGTNNIPANAR